MDEALAEVSLDLSGRAFVVFQVRFATGKIGSFDTQLIEEFLRALAREAGLTVHVRAAHGLNDHHVAEAIFKAFARALAEAKRIDPASGGDVPSTKGSL
jgi:imidazoleglycerol-phosphate dehydratase